MYEASHRGRSWPKFSVIDVPSQAISQSRTRLLLLDRDKFRWNFNKRKFILSHQLCVNPRWVCMS
jgi:hypothetical protein